MARRFSGMWDERGTAARASIILSMAFLAVGTIAAIYWSIHAPMGVLFRDLEPQTAAGIVSALDKLKVEYELDDAGTAILVDQDIVHDTRLKLMSSGAPISGGVGFEIFDETEFGMTEFTQRINYQRALQGELSRTISALREVKHARVHLVLPERSLFRKEQEPPTASVILFLKDGESLESEQIIGIQRLVASSVLELKESMVTVLNEQGVTLSRAVIKGDDYDMADLRLQRKKAIEEYLHDKVSGILGQVFSSNETAISVDVVLNYDNIRITNESVIPHEEGNSNVLRKHESRSEEGGRGNSNAKLVNSEVEYKLGRIVEQVVKTPGSIERISIGILISRDVTEDSISDIRRLIAAAVGLDEKRGDLISVKSIKHNQHISNDVEIEVPVNTGIGRTGEAEVLHQKSENGLSDNAQRTSNSLFEQLEERFGRKNATSIIIVSIAVIATILVIIGFRYRSSHKLDAKQQELSEQERERVLKLIQEWLSSEGDANKEEAQSI